MKSRLIQQNDDRTYALIFDEGDEVMGPLQTFAEDHHIGSASFTAIGAFSDVILAYFEWGKKEYRKIPIREQVEVLSLTGDIALKDDQPKVHAHVVVGKADGSAHGGHLMEAHVRPTLELILTEQPAHLQKQVDPRTGLALIRVQ